MYWTWYTIALLVIGGILLVWGLLGLWEQADGGGVIAVIGCLSIASTLLITNVHAANVHDEEAKSELQNKGFAVVEADTRSNEATILFGACIREFRLEKRQGSWQLLAKQPSGEWRLFPRSLIGNAGEACSATIS